MQLDEGVEGSSPFLAPTDSPNYREHESWAELRGAEALDPVVTEELHVEQLQNRYQTGPTYLSRKSFMAAGLQSK